MSSNSQFRHVSRRHGELESICMKCLLAVGISSSDEEVAAKEGQHVCQSEDGKLELVGM
jgi:hypothetical protein